MNGKLTNYVHEKDRQGADRGSAALLEHHKENMKKMGRKPLGGVWRLAIM